MLHDLSRDFRYAIRSLRRNRLLTLVAVISLTLGIGANSAVFGMVNAILLQPLGYPESDQLVFLWQKSPKAESQRVSAARFDGWRSHSRSFSDLAAVSDGSMVLSARERPERLAVARVSESFFGLLRVEAGIGRVFRQDEGRSGTPDVIVLTHPQWTRRFAADPNILGRTLRLDDRPFTVVGVLPASFHYYRTYDAFIPLERARNPSVADSPQHIVLGRLKAGVSTAAAQAEMESIDCALDRESPRAEPGWSVLVEPMQASLLRGPRADMPLLMAAALFVLLISCANVANLALAQAGSRSSEMALRAALGAPRRRLIRQLLVESVVLALGAGVLAVVVSAWALRAIQRLLPPGILPTEVSLAPGPVVFLFTIGVALAGGLLSGWLPAWQTSRADIQSALKQRPAEVRALGGARIRGLLVAAQLALSVILLSGALLMVRTFLAVMRASLGHPPEEVLTMQVALPETRYTTPRQTAEFLRQAVDGIARLQGVESAALSTAVPFGREYSGRGVRLPAAGPPANALFVAISEDYFRTIGQALAQGRPFNERDGPEAPRVAIVNESFAGRLLPGRNPLGQSLLVEDPPGPRAKSGLTAVPLVVQIVGVVSDPAVPVAALNPPPQLYVPYRQHPPRHCFLLLHSAEAAKASPAAEAAIRHLDPGLPVTGLHTMLALRSRALAVPRILTTLVAAFGAFALLLSLLAVYALVSYSVVQRTRELGIRLALGAPRAAIIGTVLKQAGGWAATGLGAGLAGGVGMARLLRGVLFGVPAQQAGLLAAVVLGLALFALAASYIPARRATNVDPVSALRAE